MKKINTSKAPAAVGPYSQAILSENFLFCSGQIGINPQTGKLENGIENQTHQVCKNIKAVLEEAGFNVENIVKTTIFLTNINYFPIVNKIYEKYFISKPARSTVAVAALPLGALIEIEVIAKK